MKTVATEVITFMRGIRIAKQRQIPTGHFFKALNVEDISDDELRDELKKLQKPDDLSKLWQIYLGLQVLGHRHGESLKLSAVVWAMDGVVKEALKLPEVVNDKDTDFMLSLWHKTIEGGVAEQEVEKVLMPQLDAMIEETPESGPPSFFQLHKIFRMKSLPPSFKAKVAQMMVAELKKCPVRFREKEWLNWMLDESEIQHTPVEEREMLERLIELGDIEELERIADRAKRKTPKLVDGSFIEDAEGRKRTSDHNQEHYEWQRLEASAWKAIAMLGGLISEKLLWKMVERVQDLQDGADLVEPALARLVSMKGGDLKKLDELRRYAVLHVRHFERDTRSPLQIEFQKAYRSHLETVHEAKVRSIYGWTKDYPNGWIHELMLEAVRRYYKLSQSA